MTTAAPPAPAATTTPAAPPAPPAAAAPAPNAPSAAAAPAPNAPSAAAAPAPNAPPAAAAPAPGPAEPTSLLGAAKAEPKPGEQPGAPEKYADFTLPEGVTLDKALIDKAQPLFKELGLTQDAAQKLVTLQAEGSKAGMEAVVKAAEVQRVAFLESEKLATIKALGPDYQKELGFAAKALDKFGGPELRKLMDDTGFGMNLQMAKFMISIGKAMAEGTMPGPSQAGPVDGQDLRHMFPSMFNPDGSRKV
jgi:hypothetical protein